MNVIEQHMLNLSNTQLNGHLNFSRSESKQRSRSEIPEALREMEQLH